MLCTKLAIAWTCLAWTHKTENAKWNIYARFAKNYPQSVRKLFNDLNQNTNHKCIEKVSVNATDHFSICMKSVPYFFVSWCPTPQLRDLNAIYAPKTLSKYLIEAQKSWLFNWSI